MLQRRTDGGRHGAVCDLDHTVDAVPRGRAVDGALGAREFGQQRVADSKRERER